MCIYIVNMVIFPAEPDYVAVDDVDNDNQLNVKH